MKEYLVSILSFLTGACFFACNFIFYYWLHGDFARYLWIINQPWPLSDLGGSSIQLLIHLTLTLISLIFILLSIYFAKKIK